MVKIYAKENDCKCVVTGNVTGIVAELALAIGNIYQSIKTSQGDAAADMFRVGMLVAMDPNCPAWAPTPGLVVINKKMSDTPTDQS